ncbi:MAG: hypothetical protein ABJP33_14040 [Pseudoruegeria sp.]
MNAAGRHMALRDPATVMRLKRLGSLHQCRLSFMRTLTRRMARDAWEFSTPVFEIDAAGVGHAIYCAKGPKRTYSLIAFAHDLPAELRSDRVIAEAWDATFTLFDGVPTSADIARLAQNVPLQEAGRITESELSLSRANRSVRLWAHVVDRLATGQQPDTDQLDKVGYLMRTTAVYGSGKFGAADREMVADRTELQSPFQAEMLSVYLTRQFTRDLVQHMARIKGGDTAVDLAPPLARRLGIGNSTGLGMAPFIVNHPVLFNNWIIAREEAIARVRNRTTASVDEQTMFLRLLNQSIASVGRWQSTHPIQVEKLKGLKADIKALQGHLTQGVLSGPAPWDRLMTWSQDHLSEEGQELIASLLLEPHGDLVDDLTACMSDANPAAFQIEGAMTLDALSVLLHTSFGWAFDLDWEAKDHCARLWYISAEKLEPRLGERFEESIEAYEQPLTPARDAALAWADVQTYAQTLKVADFLRHHPEHRHTVRRAQMSVLAPYGEIRDNTISADVLPIDMLRAKLSFFGAIHFDPRSDRWVRICMYAGAPYPEELTTENADFWVYPEVTA